MVIPIPPIVMPTAPATNITPFTYRDGLTYLQRLERIVKYINRVVVPYVNESYTEVAEATEEQVNLLIEQVNELVEQVINNSIELQDPVMAALIQDEDSETYNALLPLLSAVLVEDPDDPGTYITGLNLPDPDPAE